MGGVTTDAVPARTRIGHVHLKVADLERALGFCCTGTGRRGGGRGVLMGGWRCSRGRLTSGHYWRRVWGERRLRGWRLKPTTN
jgi:hypothetical protein